MFETSLIKSFTYEGKRRWGTYMRLQIYVSLYVEGFHITKLYKEEKTNPNGKQQ